MAQPHDPINQNDPHPSNTYLSAQRIWQLAHLYSNRRSGVYERQIPPPDELEGLARILTLQENRDMARYAFGLINGSLDQGIRAVVQALEAELRRYLAPETPTRTEPLL